MTTAAVGSIGKAEENFVLTLADADAFRTWVGAADQAAAKNRIHLEGLPPPDDGHTYTLAELQAVRPYAMFFTRTWNLEQDAGGGPFGYGAPHGTISCAFVQDVPSAIANHPGEVGRRFINTIDGIVVDMKGLSGDAGYLAIRRIAVPEPWWRSTKEELATEGDVQAVELLFEY